MPKNKKKISMNIHLSAIVKAILIKLGIPISVYKTPIKNILRAFSYAYITQKSKIIIRTCRSQFICVRFSANLA